MYKHILLPTDGSDITAKAITAAVALAQLTGADVTTVSVNEPYPVTFAGSGTGGGLGEMGRMGGMGGMGVDVAAVPFDLFEQTQRKVGQSRIDAVASACAAVGVRCHAHLVDAAHPWEAIIAQAVESDCDLIVMASHGRRGMSALLLGSETQKVLTHTQIPVLVVR